MRKYCVIGDSCMDLTKDLKNDPRFRLVPLTLQVGDTFVTDDESFDQKAFLKLTAESSEVPHSACPSPEAYRKAICEAEAEMVFIVTLSEHLSGSYNAAVLGKNLYEEEHANGSRVHVFSSDSASVGETLIGLKICEMAEQGCGFEEIIEGIDRFRKEQMKTFFVLDDMEALRKNGRLSGLTALVVNTLNIRPVMTADSGRIARYGQAHGTKKALAKMAAALAEQIGADAPNRILAIAHCNCVERAREVKRLCTSLAKFRDVMIVDTAGVSSLYACDGGIIVCC